MFAQEDEHALNGKVTCRANTCLVQKLSGHSILDNINKKVKEKGHK
jgi:hypothetical protein